MSDDESLPAAIPELSDWERPVLELRATDAELVALLELLEHAEAGLQQRTTGSYAHSFTTHSEGDAAADAAGRKRRWITLATYFGGEDFRRASDREVQAWQSVATSLLELLQ